MAACMIIGGCLCIGILYAHGMKCRVEELRQVERIINYIEGEIRYKNSLLKEACLSASLRCGQPFKQWLEKLGERIEGFYMDSFGEIWEDSLDELRENSCLKNEDIREINLVGQTLGYLDIRTQEMGLGLEKEIIHNNVERLDKGLANNMKVSVILGGLSGLMLVIILL